jgi:nitroreductase
VETDLAIASRRDERRYSDRPVPQDAVTRIVDAGRLAGSARNRQPWRFIVVDNPELRERLAGTVYAPDNVRSAALVVAVAGKAGLDVGRAVQNMLLAAWDAGLASCPNGMPDPSATARLLGVDEVAIVLSFGYPAQPRDPRRRSPEEWSARANRKPLEELVERR